MQLADLVPSGRRMSPNQGETTAVAAVNAVSGLARRASGEESFAEILAGKTPIAEEELPVVDAPEALEDVPTPEGATTMLIETDPEVAATAPPLPEASNDTPPAALAAITEPEPPVEPKADVRKPLAENPSPAVAVSPRQSSAFPEESPSPSAPDLSTDDATPAATGNTTASPAAASPATAAPVAPAMAASAVQALVPEAPAAAPGWRLEADAPLPASPRSGETPAAVPSQPPGRQIAAAVAQAGGGMVEIRLDPPELGRVQIRLEPAEDGLRAVVLAERAETQDLLRRNADQLARDLTEAGYARVSLDFAAGGESARRDEHPARGFALATTASTELQASGPADVGRPTRAGVGLDVRL